MVFFSSDRLEVERVSFTLAAAGIPCLVREGIQVDFSYLPEAEVWIKRDKDLSRAFLLCMKENIGFAKRETNVSEYFDEMAVAA